MLVAVVEVGMMVVVVGHGLVGVLVGMAHPGGQSLVNVGVVVVVVAMAVGVSDLATRWSQSLTSGKKMRDNAAVAIRKKLQDLKEILEELGQRTSPPSPKAMAVVAQFAENARAQIERMPQLSLVRPATIALRNLATSLQHNEAHETIADDVGAALEAVTELLEEPDFGFAPEELTARATEILGQRGVLKCPVCREATRTVEVVSMPIRPFPADRSRHIKERPLAMLTCQTCGKINWHDLAALSIM